MILSQKITVAELDAAIANLQAQEQDLSSLRGTLYSQQVRAKCIHDRIKQQLRSLQAKRERRIGKQAS